MAARSGVLTVVCLQYRMGISARRARMQLNNIFKQGQTYSWDPVAMHHARALSQRVRKQVVQDLAFSSKNAKDDIDSYFDSMQPETHKYSHHHEQHEAGGHEVRWTDQLTSSLTTCEGYEPCGAPTQPGPVQGAEPGVRQEA
eukprot:438650-Hanusia_phi.AAC.2